MISRQVFFQIANDAQNALLDYHLNDALFAMPSLLKEIDNEDYSRRFEAIQRDYNAMLDFLASGGQDPNAQEMQSKMVRKTYLLINALKGQFNAADEHHYIYPFLNSDSAFAKGLLACLLDMNQDAETCRELFRISSHSDIQLLLSGMTLNIWDQFNPHILSTLAELSVTEPRALTAVVMTVLKYEKELELFPDSAKQIETLFSDPVIHEHVTRIIREFFISSQSERLQAKINEEIMPALLEGAKDERLRMGFDLDEAEDMFEKMVKSQMLGDKDKKSEKKKKTFLTSAMRLLDMQAEGVDINTELFVNGMRLPFFLNLENWFKPYSVHDAAIESITYDKGKPNVMLKIVLEQGNLCDIDKYAITLMLGQYFQSSNTRDVLRMLQQQMAEAESVAGSDFVLTAHTKDEEITNFVRSLYRVFVKSRWKKQFANLFDSNLNPLDNKYLSAVYADNARLLESTARLMYKYDQTSIPLRLFRRLGELEGSTAETLQMQAFCLQAQQKYRQAVNLLVQADLLQPDEVVTLKQLLVCYDKLEQYDNLLEVLQRLEQIIPESSKITTDTGLCLMKLGRFQEASQRFYKLELEEKKVIPSMRAIAWCAFQQKKYETAARYYKKLFNTPGAAIWEDYLNCGHVTWLMGDTTTALTFYHQYIKRYLTDDPKITNALEPFSKDEQTLLDHGKSAREISLMYELIGH